MLIISSLASRTSKPASCRRLTARITSSGSERKFPTVSASASASGSNIEMPPTERGDASAKIRFGKPARSFGGSFGAGLVARLRRADELVDRFLELALLRLRGVGGM